MGDIDTEPVPIVLVTGASGYIATHVVKVLQDEGYRVRGTVRSLKNKNKVGELQNLAPNARHPLELVEADLTSAAAWKEAVKDCTYVMHTASPFPEFGKIKDPENQVIKPAVEGTRAVMDACMEAGTVKRVVLTSSCAAIFGEFQPDKELYTEDDWTDTNSKECDHYYKSKTLAEKEAWRIVKDNPGKIELAVINPLLVLGPVLTSGVSGSTSVQFLRQVIERDYPWSPAICSSLCDVRDVALAHFKAMILPEAAGHRHIIGTGNLWVADVGKILHKELSPYGYNPTTANLPKAAAWVGSFFLRQLSNFVYPRWGAEPVYSNKRMREVLGIEPRPAETTITEMAYSLLDRNIIKQTEKYKKSRENTTKARY